MPAAQATQKMSPPVFSAAAPGATPLNYKTNPIPATIITRHYVLSPLFISLLLALAYSNTKQTAIFDLTLVSSTPPESWEAPLRNVPARLTAPYFKM